MAPSATTTPSCPVGTANAPSPSDGIDRLHHRPAQEGPQAEPADGAEQGHHQRLAADHPAQLAPALPHGPKQPQLAGALVDRQGQRVGDAHEGDHDGHDQQHVDDRQDLVDLAGNRVEVLLAVLDVGCPEAVGNRLDGGLPVGRRHAVDQVDEQHDVTRPGGGVRCVGRLRQDHVVDQLVVVEDRPKRELVGGPVREGHRHRIPESEAVVRGVVGEQRHLPVAQVVDGPLRDVHVEHPLERGRVDHRGHGVVAADRHGRDAHPGGHVDLGQGTDGGLQLGREPGAAEVRLRDHQVAGELLRHGVVDGLLDGRRHHGEQRDHGDADHQRRRGAGGAAGIAHGIAPRQRPAHPPPQRQRPAHDARNRASHHGAEEHEADDHQERTQAGQGQRTGARGAADRGGNAAAGDHHAQNAAHPRGARPVDGDVPQGGQGRDAARP